MIYYQAYATPQFWDFQLAQLEELLTGYGPVAEVWIDIPGLLPRGIRTEHYRQIAHWQPGAVIMMNHGVGDGSKLEVE
jgi:alpha-L-fucosidase